MDDGRDDLILEERLAGRSVPAIAKQHGCSSIEVEAVIDRRLNFALDNDMRLRAIKLDVARLEALMVPFFERATKDKDVAAGTLCCKLLERRALLLGLDQPTRSRVDVYQVQAHEKPDSFDRIHAAIMRVVRERQERRRNGGDAGADELSPRAVDALESSTSAMGWVGRGRLRGPRSGRDWQPPFTLSTSTARGSSRPRPGHAGLNEVEGWGLQSLGVEVPPRGREFCPRGPLHPGGGGREPKYVPEHIQMLLEHIVRSHLRPDRQTDRVTINGDYLSTGDGERLCAPITHL